MINKELLSEVLKSKVRSIEIVNNTVTYTLCHSIIGFIYINIHELAHKCKEWAFNKGYDLLIYGGVYYNIDVHRISNKSKTGELIESFASDSEPEAVFKACQWILDNKTIN